MAADREDGPLDACIGNEQLALRHISDLPWILFASASPEAALRSQFVTSNVALLGSQIATLDVVRTHLVVSLNWRSQNVTSNFPDLSRQVSHTSLRFQIGTLNTRAWVRCRALQCVRQHSGSREFSIILAADYAKPDCVARPERVSEGRGERLQTRCRSRSMPGCR